MLVYCINFNSVLQMNVQHIHFIYSCFYFILAGFAHYPVKIIQMNLDSNKLQLSPDLMNHDLTKFCKFFLRPNGNETKMLQFNK